MSTQDPNEPPVLSPQPGPPPPNKFSIFPGLPPPSAEEESIEEGESKIIEEAPKINPIKKIPRGLIIGGLLLILAIIVGLTVNEVIFNKITALSLVPDNAEYYLTLSVKEHPQVQKSKDLVKKLPAGEKMLESLDKYSSELLGQQDPFEDIIRLSKKEIFLARLYPEADQETQSFGGLTDMLNIVELPRPKDVREELGKFEKDPDNYDITDQDHIGQKIYSIKLKDKSSSARQRTNVGLLPSRVTLPLSKSVFATQVKNLIVAGENIADVKRSIDLAKVKSIFGFKNSELKSLQDDPAHKKISKYFPEETLVRFYQNQPLAPFGNFLPNQSLGQSFLIGQSVRGNPNERAETFTRVPQGLTVTAEDDGMILKSYQLDLKDADEPLKNPFKIEDSLANRLPKTFNGVSPFFYGEIKNYYQVYRDQIEEMKDIAENSDNRTQREEFKKSLENLEKTKSEFRKNAGIDYEKDLLVYLDSHAATIFNAGNAKKSPEYLLVADVKDGAAVQNSLAKIKIPDYIKEAELRTNDTRRTGDVTKIGSAIKLYMEDNNKKVPISLSELTSKYIKKIPKDPVTKKSYPYTPSNNLTIATVEATLSDSRTYIWSSSVGYGKYKGVAKKVSLPPTTPEKSSYKNTVVYSLKIYEYQKFSYYLYFGVADKKLVILFGADDQSLKDVIDFSGKSEDSLASSDSWKKQFENKGEMGGFIYIEPIQLWGIVEYIQSLYPEYKAYINNDLEVAVKGYLKTLKSIGTVVGKDKDVHITSTYVHVEELPSDEKEKVKAAVQRLLDADANNGYRSVLGVNTSTDTLELWKGILKRLFVPPAMR